MSGATSWAGRWRRDRDLVGRAGRPRRAAAQGRAGRTPSDRSARTRSKRCNPDPLRLCRPGRRDGAPARVALVPADPASVVVIATGGLAPLVIRTARRDPPRAGPDPARATPHLRAQRLRRRLACPWTKWSSFVCGSEVMVGVRMSHVFSEAQEGATYERPLGSPRLPNPLALLGSFDPITTSGSWVTAARPDGRLGDTRRPGPRDAPHPARHPGQPGDLPVARPARDHGREVDEMSGGRVELGLGVRVVSRPSTGLRHPVPGLRTRFDRFAEQVEIIDGLWRTPLGEPFTYRARTTSSPTRRRCRSRRSPRVHRSSSAEWARSAPRGWSPVSPTSTTSGGPTRRDIRRSSPAASDLAARRDPASSSTPPRRWSASAGTRPRCVAGPPRSDRTSRSCARPAHRHPGRGGRPDRRVRRARRSRIYLQVLDLTDLDQLELIASEVLPQL